MEKKRGLSPVIATVLLIAMVVVIGLIIFLWFRGMTEETITKFGGTNIKLVCEDVEFSASYSQSSGILSVANTGNVPIFKLKAKIDDSGNYETRDLNDFSGLNWPNTGLSQGGTFSGDISGYVGGADEVLIIPVLLGNSDEGEKLYVCEERFGEKII